MAPEQPFEHCMEKARDVATGVEGTITARSVYSNGCVRFLIEFADANGRPIDHWCDEQNLELVESGERVGTAATAGGPRDGAMRASTPPR